jgi:RNA polymerase sigma factor (sigma-70 family)
MGELAVMTIAHHGPILTDIQRLFTDGTATVLSEAQLLERYLDRGDEAAFEAILHRHGPMVLGVCRRTLSNPHDVQDAFQATFLVLVKEANSIRDRDVLGTWLYRVARRVAVRAQIDARRRRAHEWKIARGKARMDSHVERDESSELRAVIDEELGRLTEKYRFPLILCDLEGQTHEQAAVQLRCPVGTVKSRLSRARAKLRSRLVRRGLDPVPATLAVAPAADLTAAMPADLLRSTIDAVTQLAAGRVTAAGAASAAIAALVQDPLRTLTMITLKSAAVALTAAVVIAAGAGVFARQSPKDQLAQDDRAPRPAESIADDRIARSAEPGSVKVRPDPAPGRTVAALAGARYQAARKFLDTYRSEYLRGRGSAGRARTGNIETLRSKALRVLEAQRDVNDAKANRIAALEDYLGVIKEAEKLERSIDDPDRNSIAEAEYYRLAAELWLARARAGTDPLVPGAASGDRPISGQGDAPGTDPRSRALVARLEEPIPMHFPTETPLEEVVKYIRQATAGPDGEGIPIYVDPWGLQMQEKTMKSPITIDLAGVPLRRTLKLIADQIDMGYGIKDGVVTIIAADARFKNWRELRVLEPGSFPMSSPLQLQVEKAERGELTEPEIEQLNDQLKVIEEASKRYRSIRMQKFGPVPAAGKQAPSQ